MKIEIMTLKKYSDWLIYLLIVLTIILLYGRTIGYDYAIDDKIMISENSNVSRGVAAIPDIFTHTTFYGFKNYQQGTDLTYRPLTLSVFATEISVFGTGPSVHHTFSVFYYLLLCLMIYYLMSRYVFKAGNKWMAAAVSLLFCIHPVHTEVVCNIKSRDEILCLLLFIASLIFVFRGLEKKHSYRRSLYFFISSLLYFACLFTKETAVSFILIFPLTLWIFSGMLTVQEKKTVFSLLGFHLFWLCLYFFIRYQVISAIDNFAITEVSILNNALLEHGFLQRYLMAFFILLLYLKLLIFPHPLIWDYSLGHFQYGNIIVLLGILSLLLYTYLLIIAINGLKKKSLMSYCIFFYLVSISLVSNLFVPISSTMGERFLFTPSLAFCIVVVLGLKWIIKSEIFSRMISFKYMIVSVLAVFILFFLVKTEIRVNDWQNESSLILHDHSFSHSLRSHITYIETRIDEIEKYPDNQVIINTLYHEIKQILLTVPERTGKAGLYYTCGNAMLKMNKQMEAIQFYKRAIALQPAHTEAIFNLASIYHLSGDLELADKLYEDVIRMAKRGSQAYIMALGNKGMIMHVKGYYDLAKTYYKEAIHLGTPDKNVAKYYESLVQQGLSKANTIAE